MDTNGLEGLIDRAYALARQQGEHDPRIAAQDRDYWKLADALEAALAEVERLTQLSTVTEDLPTMDGWSKNDRSTITS